MQQSSMRKLNHIQYMLDRIEAEVAALEARNEAHLALAQLDAREAAGEPVTAVDSAHLRACLVRQIAASPLAASRRKLAEIKALLDPSHSSDAVMSSNVVDLATHRALAGAAKPVWRPFAAVARAVAVALFLAMGAVSTVQHPQGLGRAQFADLAVPLARPATPGAVDGF